jgi:hypothetical protein
MEQRATLDFLSTNRITNLPTSTANGHPVVHEQLQSVLNGLAWKDSARAASTANVNVSAPGTTIDGVTMAANDRVLLKNQTTASENGLYVWAASGSPMSRALDADAADELEGAVVTVEEGTVNAGTTWRQTAVNFTLGSGSITWSAFGANVPAATETVAGIAEIATQAETDAGSDDSRIVTPNKLANSPWARIPPFTQTIGNGSATSFTVTHNLGTTDVTVTVKKAAGSENMVSADWRASSANAVVVDITPAPSTNEFRVIVRA